MKKTISTLFASILASFLITGYSNAAVNEISEEQLQEVKANCEAEAKEATYPKEYIEQCIEDNMQALKEQGQEPKEPS